VHGVFVALLAVTLILVTGGLAAAAANPNARDRPAYGWPIEPCDQQHPVRGHFGAPRTIFAEPLSHEGLYGPGRVSFHNGIDIVAPAGTAVYPVVSGVVRRISGGLAVVADDGREFRYQHITRLARAGERVRACRTILGYVQPRKDHVHFVEVDRGKVVNPLMARHLRPYVDMTQPHIDAVRLIHGRAASAQTTTVERESAASAQVGHEDVIEVRGRIRLGAEAHDLPTLPIDWPREWATMRVIPLVPAVLEVTLRRPGPHKVALRLRSHADFTDTVPLNEHFWRVYRRGTHQNWPVIGGRWHKRKPGAYHFRFPRIDTRKLQNGRYALRVTAFDARGNSGSLRVWVRVKN